MICPEKAAFTTVMYVRPTMDNGKTSENHVNLGRNRISLQIHTDITHTHYQVTGKMYAYGGQNSNIP